MEQTEAVLAERKQPALPVFASRQHTIAMQIHTHLRQQVVAGVLRPMQCLSEKELAAAMGVSRTPVREALGKLEEEGLVQIRPQFGTFVSPILAGGVSSSQFVREALECAAAREAARRCTPADQEELEQILMQQRPEVSDTEFFEADDRLHRRLMALAGQEAAWRVVHAAKATIDRVRYLSVKQPAKRKTILIEHRRIVAAVAARKEDAAVAAMHAHLQGVFASTERTMRQHPEFFGATPDAARPNRRRRQA
ncbi:MAG: GntR family transcriptional regulator [Janthinobacterium lividum]